MFRRFDSGSSRVAARNALAGIAVLAAALAGAAGGASAQSDWDKVVAEAKKEGKVVIYNGTNFKIVRQLGDQFQKEYGIAVEVLDGRASEIRERIRTEQAAGRAIGDLIYRRCHRGRRQHRRRRRVTGTVIASDGSPAPSGRSRSRCRGRGSVVQAGRGASGRARCCPDTPA